MSLIGSRAQLAIAIHEIGAFLLSDEGYQLKHHEERPELPPSPYRLNIRTADHSTNPGNVDDDVLGLIGIALRRTISREELHFNHICGIPEAGEPIAKALKAAREADELETSLLTLHKTEEDGKRRITGPVEGSYRRGDSVLVIDDVITSGSSKIEAITVLESHGLRVAGILVVVDRRVFNGHELCQKYSCHSVMTINELVAFYREKGLISDDQYQRIEHYHRVFAHHYNS